MRFPTGKSLTTIFLLPYSISVGTSSLALSYVCVGNIVRGIWSMVLVGNLMLRKQQSAGSDQQSAWKRKPLIHVPSPLAGEGKGEGYSPLTNHHAPAALLEGRTVRAPILSRSRTGVFLEDLREVALIVESALHTDLDNALLRVHEHILRALNSHPGKKISE
jgi:hypothetical protein